MLGNYPVEDLGFTSCRLCLGRFRLVYVLSLRPFLALHNLKLDVIAFLKALVAFRLDGAIVDKNIRTVFPANKAEALRIVKPFHFTFNSRHFPYSNRPGWAQSTFAVRPGPFLL